MNIRKPLLDKTLVITRSFEQSEPLSSELVDLGAKIISLPLITIAEPTDNGKGLEGGESVLVGPDNGLLAPTVALVGGADRAVSLTETNYQLLPMFY